MAKHLSSRGAGKHPEHRQWKEHVKESGLEEADIPALLGHRFNVQFVVAARIFVHLEAIYKFAKRYTESLDPVLPLFKDPICRAQLRFLGLVDQLITGPLWRIAETAADLCSTSSLVSCIVSFIEKAIADPSQFLSGVPPVLPYDPGFQVFNVGGVLLKGLSTVSPSAELVTVAKKGLLAMHTYLSGVYGDHLPGGVYHNASLDVTVETKSTPSTNRSVESAFAFMDRLYARAPNMRHFRREASTLFTLNHTRDWLDSLSVDERTAIVTRAFHECKGVEVEAKETSSKVSGKVRERMETKRAEMKDQAKKGEVKLSSLVTTVASTGVVWHESSLVSILQPLGQTAAISMVKTQLRYRKTIMNQIPSDPKLYRFSLDGKPLSLSELSSNLSLLLSEWKAAGHVEDRTPLAYVGRVYSVSEFKGVSVHGLLRVLDCFAG